MNITDFESACKHWESAISDFIKILYAGNIPALQNSEWEFSKHKIGVCEPDERGRKKRCRLMHGHSDAHLNSAEAEIVWILFEAFAKEKGLSSIERQRNNEEIGMYKFTAENSDTGDRFSVGISMILPIEWSDGWTPIAGMNLHAWVGARYRKVDL
jgi:hypothetical protein